MLTRPPYTELFYQALASPFGIAVEVGPSTERARNALYKARKFDPAFEALMIRSSPFATDQLWIMKKDPSDAYNEETPEEGDPSAL
jgi:hypothetical protein